MPINIITRRYIISEILKNKMMLTWILGVLAVVLQISAGSPTSVESLVKVKLSYCVLL